MNAYERIMVLIIIIAVLAVLLVVFLYRRKMRNLMNSLSQMLDKALQGEFSEKSFDESMLSALEAKMAQFLSSYAALSEKTKAEKEHIKRLISDISHQTKTPVANLRLYSELLAEKNLAEDSAAYVKILSQQAQKLEFLVDALVKTSRLESGIITVQLQKGSVAELIQTSVGQAWPKADARYITIQIEADKTEAYYDPKWTVEALYNILDNAVKYSPEHSTIQIRVIPYEMFCRIDITDQGMGIDEDERNKIFSRFYRAPAASTYGGVGIGLFLTREILSAGDGYIKVDSKPGQGSVFSVFLPLENRRSIQH